MTYKNIIYEKRGRIAILTLNRPQVLNALSSALLDEMDVALIEAEQDDGIRVIIIKGAGRAFSAGADIEPREQSTAQGERSSFDVLLGMRETTRKVTTIWNLSKPVIAQVHGYCVGQGNDIAGQCDIIIAAENAVFGRPEARRLGIGWMDMYTYNAGLQWAKMLLFTGDTISGKQAERIGLVAQAVPEDELEEDVNNLAERIALVPLEFLVLHKAWINRTIEEMGLRNVINAGMEADAIAYFTKPYQDFLRMAKEKGLKAALKANNAPFNALPKPFEEKPEG